MAGYRCGVCEYIHDENKTGDTWKTLPHDWKCPVCGSPVKCFTRIEDESTGTKKAETPSDIGETATTAGVTIDLQKTTADVEEWFADIHEMAETGESIYEPMRTKLSTVSWNDILIKGAQLAAIPLEYSDPVNTRTVIGPKARVPLVIETPIFITHMSFGALSMEAKSALAEGSAAAKTAMCSGEGGILPESLDRSYKYIFEYVPNRYSVTEENLRAVDAIEIKFGQSAKPGMGGHLPGDKVTREIAEIRGFEKGVEIFSPSSFRDIRNRDELREKVDWLREVSSGKPIGIKVAAGHIEKDMKTAVYARPDFITIDGRAGATGSAPKYIKAATSVPTIFVVDRARKVLADKNEDITLIITGGLRVSPDFAKALAMGADAIAIGTSALMAIGCRQYRICNTGKCPMGIATQETALRARFDAALAARRLENYLSVMTRELKEFARLTGKADVHDLTLQDLCTTNSEISNFTAIEHV